jgi:hypothetical protein
MKVVDFRISCDKYAIISEAETHLILPIGCANQLIRYAPIPPTRVVTVFQINRSSGASLLKLLENE